MTDNAVEGESQSHPVIFLLGPTASGKTAASILLAKAMDAEIISVDSALVYRHMNIGTAKPNALEQDGVPHHLIDICDPDEPYSAARFCEDALTVIEQIHSKGKQALLTGGTMLYFQALEQGIAPMPVANPEIRERLNKQAEAIGWPAMHEQLREVDPDAAARIHPNDPQRLQRALEVFELTGQSLTTLQAKTKPLLAVPPIKFALVPADRAWLHNRIELRFQQMLDAGFLDEVRSLMQQYSLNENLPSMRSVGYRQAWQYCVGDIDHDTMVAKAQAATRQLAKRQLTWIRGMDNLSQLSCDTLSPEQQAEYMKLTIESGLSLRR